jgi:chromate transporter
MTQPPPSLAQTFWAFLRIGLMSFGGPAGQIATMHRILVDEKKWLDEDRFLHALNFCMLLPGPEAQQLATYAGWVLHRIRGGLMAGLLFILPGFLVMMGLAAFYAAFQGVGVVQALFAGLKPAVLAVVLDATLRVGRRALRDRVAWLIAGTSLVAIFAFAVPFPLIVAGAGLFGYLSSKGTPSNTAPSHPSTSWRTVVVCLLLWIAPIAAALTWGQGAFGAIGLFFAKMAVVTFGGAYAVLAYVAQQAVEVYGWLGPAEMLDGLGLAETTPGPLILVNQFVGFLAGFRDPGPLGPWMGGIVAATLTVWVTFAPSFLWIFAGAPHVERIRANPRLTGALAAITAAVVGVILNLALWFGLHVVFATVGTWSAGPLAVAVPDPETVRWWAVGLAAASAVALIRFRLGMLPVLAASAGLGLFLQ